MTRRFRYAVYGFAVDSDLELPGLAAGEADGAALAVRGALASDPGTPALRPAFTSELETLWHLDEARWLLRYDGRSMNAPSWSIQASRGGRRLDVRWAQADQAADIASFLPGPGLALALHMRGVLPLHAGAVAVGGRAALIMGPSGAGKSTTLAALLRRGLPLITDDVSALAEGPDGLSVHPGPRRLRLYAASAKAAGWDCELPRLFRHRGMDDKRYITVDNASASHETTPVAAMFLLRPRRSSRSPLRIERLPTREALRPLLANLYCGRFLDRVRAARVASLCADVAARVPVFAITAPDDLGMLPMLVDELLGAVRRGVPMLSPRWSRRARP